MNPDFIEKQIEKAESQAKRDGMEKVGTIPNGDGPEWIRLPDEFDLKGSAGKWFDVTGNTFVYRAISQGGGYAIVYRQLKSEYYETTPEEGTCPECQSYVRRYDSDEYLTCHRCGWQYKRPGHQINGLFRSIAGRVRSLLPDSLTG